MESITKVVAADTPQIAEELKDLYGAMNGGNIFVAASIKVAEAAKVIENAQRDINIAFINEITQIFAKLEISAFDVLEAAGTKWNFLPFTPGLVGGHCIGVDPYYLAECAQNAGYHPQMILAGRATNNQMAITVSDFIHHQLTPHFSKPGKLLVLGLTFKENVPDLRNTKVVDLVSSLRKKGYDLDIVDPEADPKEAHSLYNLTLAQREKLPQKAYQGIILAVPHDAFRAYGADTLQNLLQEKGRVLDLKGIWRKTEVARTLPYWTL